LKKDKTDTSSPLPMNMRAMVLEKAGEPLILKEISLPRPGEDQVLVKVLACGVCRTDQHIVDGELSHPRLPLIPGHEIVGRVAGTGRHVTNFQTGDSIGVPWLAYTCGKTVRGKAKNELRKKVGRQPVSYSFKHQSFGFSCSISLSKF
jgi:propanol-preferring alcohol dehydrogenase